MFCDDKFVQKNPRFIARLYSRYRFATSPLSVSSVNDLSMLV